MTDISDTLAPKSDQLDAVDLLGGPRTFTVTQVDVNKSAEQPVFIHLAEFPGRTYRPSKSMRRVLVAAWGKEADVYAGRRLTLYRDPDVTFGRDKVGGIKIAAMSHIDKPITLALTATRGKRALHKVTVLPDATPAAPVDVSEATDVDALRAAWQTADPDTRKAIEARVTELTKGAGNDD